MRRNSRTSTIALRNESSRPNSASLVSKIAGIADDPEDSIPSLLNQILQRQKYHMIGSHSAVKRCRWFHETLVNNRPCYKEKFYGIRTHQCIQMSPSVYNCTQQCVFCWRAQDRDLQLEWNETEPRKPDLPEKIVDQSIKAQLRILSGYKGNPKTDLQKYNEALTPRHVAISLSGEPMLYSRIGELIEVFQRKNFTTFLVTNGTLPVALAQLREEPTQLYVSLCAPNEEVFERTCRPQIREAWVNLNRTLSLLSSFRCPTVVRMTLVRGLNMSQTSDYGRLIDSSNPSYIETKSYMHVGFSRRRLGFENMPDYGEIKEFARVLAGKTGYDVVDESEESRVVLLSRVGKPAGFFQS